MNRYTSITSPDINNGTGFRVTLWLSGCDHKCPGCHNEWMWDYSIGTPLEESKTEVTNAAWHEYIKGLTISGGDPLMRNREDLRELRDYIRWFKKVFSKIGRDVWIYTGYDLNELTPAQFEVVNECDVICTGRYVEALRDLSLPFRGSSNQTLYKVIKLDNGAYGYEEYDIEDGK